MTGIFRALKYRNFRLFFIGQIISVTGTWMQQVAIGWLAYRLSGSALILGIVGFSSQIPVFLFSPFAGVLVDRWRRRRILLWTQSLSMAQALLLALLTLTGAVTVWHVVALGFVLGCVNALDIPARQSFLIDMVEEKDLLGNAIALNSSIFNMARLIGPSIAGVMIAFVGEGVCFLVNGISFIAVIISLALMNIGARTNPPERHNIIHGLAEGIRYTFGSAPIRAILYMISVISATGMSYVVLMPVFAKNILHGGPRTLGFLMASIGVGALAAGLFLASRKKALKLGAMIPVSSSIFAVGLIAFSLSHILWLSLILLMVTGFGFMVHAASCNTVLQNIVEDDKRGRVMSFYAVAFMGMAPLGSLLAGGMANRIGVAGTVIIGGVLCLAASFVFARKLSSLRGLAHPSGDEAGIAGVIGGDNGVIHLAERQL